VTTPTRSKEEISIGSFAGDNTKKEARRKILSVYSLKTTPTKSKEENTISSFAGDNTNEMYRVYPISKTEPEQIRKTKNKSQACLYA